MNMIGMADVGMGTVVGALLVPVALYGLRRLLVPRVAAAVGAPGLGRGSVGGGGRGGSLVDRPHTARGLAAANGANLVWGLLVLAGLLGLVLLPFLLGFAAVLLVVPAVALRLLGMV